MRPRPPKSTRTAHLFPSPALFRSHRLSTPMEMLCTQRRAIVLFNESDSQLSLSVDAPPSRGIEASDWSAWRPDCRHLREPKAHDLCRHQIGRAHVGTPVTNAQLVCRPLLEKKKQKNKINDRN